MHGMQKEAQSRNGVIPDNTHLKPAEPELNYPTF